MFINRTAEYSHFIIVVESTLSDDQLSERQIMFANDMCGVTSEGPSWTGSKTYSVVPKHPMIISQKFN